MNRSRIEKPEAEEVKLKCEIGIKELFFYA